jgi:hypothetical protein
MKQYLMVTLMTLAATYCKAQIQEHPIDFLDLNHATLKKNFDYNSNVKVKINNINRFLFKIAAEKTELDYNITPPAILSGIKLPAFINTSLPIVATGAQPAPVKKDPNRTLLNISGEIDKTIAELNKSEVLINQAILAHNKVVETSKQCAKSFSDISSTAGSQLDRFLTDYKIVPAVQIADKADQVLTLLSDNGKEANKLYDALKDLVGEWSEKHLEEFRKNQRDRDHNLAVAKQALEALNEQYKNDKPADTPNTLIKIRQKEKEIRGQEADVKEAGEDFESEKTIQATNFEKAGTLISDIKTYQDETKLYALVNDLKKVNESNYSYTSETVKMKKDEIKIKFSVTTDERLTCNAPTEQQFEMELHTKGGWKIDFSTGVFVNGGSKTFMGEEYYYKSLNDTQTVIKSKDAGKRLMPSIGALMQVYRRSEANLKIGGTAGVSATADLTSLNFHLGGSAIFGKKDRIIFSLGTTLREVSILDRNYTADKTYTTKELPEAVPTIKKFPEFGWFVALTYNFSAFNK